MDGSILVEMSTFTQEAVDMPTMCSTIGLNVGAGSGNAAVASMLLGDSVLVMLQSRMVDVKLNTQLATNYSILCLDYKTNITSTVSMLVECVDWQPWLPPMLLEILHDCLQIRPMPWPPFISSSGCYMSRPLQQQQNIRCIPAIVLLKFLECILGTSVQEGCAEMELHLVAGLIFGVGDIYIQSSRGVVVMLSGLIWLLEHSIDLSQKLVELTLWLSSVLMLVLGSEVKLRPMPWPYFICGQSFGVFMLKSESSGGPLITKGDVCMDMPVLTTWARTKAIYYSSHGAWELFFSTIMQHREQMSKLLQCRVGNMGFGDMVTFMLELAMDPELNQPGEPGGAIELERCVNVLVPAASKSLMFITVKGTMQEPWDPGGFGLAAFMLCATLAEFHATANCFLDTSVSFKWQHGYPSRGSMDVLWFSSVLSSDGRAMSSIHNHK